MRLKTANKRRARALRRRADGLPWRWFVGEAYRLPPRLIGFDPGREVTCYGGALGGGKSFAMAKLRARLAAGGLSVAPPDLQTWRDELAVYGTAIAEIQPRGGGVYMRHITREEFEREYPSDGAATKV